ncbi:Hypothetical predicted protein [Paramuricea clavata]|uniref:Uncharacterized protein n=1 Tax=Paramuricea clavata TaxID=317549 RepID=A0A6S7FQU1_PARCT|nr:Hypothetical predicted protein [Paramuricea clavata]
MTESAFENSPSGTAYPRDPPKNDIAVYRSAATDNLAGQRYNVMSHHSKAFETDAGVKNDVISENNKMDHRKTQHFTRGKIPGGSKTNTMIYGAEHFAKNLTQRRRKENEDNGFLYGSSAVRRFENKNPGRRLNHNLLLGDLTDGQRVRHRKLAVEEDNYLSKHYERRTQQQSQVANEKKKDFEMLKSYNPWGKPGGGAPRGYRNDEVDANVTKHVRKLKQENGKPAGVGGGGSPNRTTSGTVVTSLKMNPELRFQAAQYNTDPDPRLRYKPNYSYGKELDAQVNESTNRRILEKKKEKEEDIKMIETNPFGNREVNQIKRKDATQPASLTNEGTYDPWGKGYGGVPERKENGKIMRNRQHLNDKFKNEHSWDSTDGVSLQKENVNPRKKTTLAKNTCGQTYIHEVSPKGSPYNPWGRPGAGAPLKDKQGNVMTNTTGKLANDNMGSSAQLKRDPVRKKEYLKSLEQQHQELEVLREEERTNYMKPDRVGVVNWLRQGKVGQPNYDSQTKEIRANPKATSDVTREKLQIRRLINDNSKCYYDDLQEMADERNRRRQIDRAKERELSFDHIKTMNDVWGRPGGGAPMMKLKDQIISPRKHSDELIPTERSIFR